MKKSEVGILEIKPLELNIVEVKIAGVSPLIEHAWSEKAKREMLEKQMKKTVAKAKEARNPVEDFIRSLYWITPMPEEFTMEAFDEAVEQGARFGFPVTAFKDAAISAAYRMKWIKNKMEMRGVFFIEGESTEDYSVPLVEIQSDKPIMREDMVRIGNGSADIRYRAELRNWSATLRLTCNMSGGITAEQIVNIINAGGFVCGVGEWRPEKDGQNGMFRVATTD